MRAQATPRHMQYHKHEHDVRRCLVNFLANPVFVTPRIKTIPEACNQV